MKKTLHISKFKPSAFQGKFDFDAVSKKRTRVLAVEYPLERAAFAGLLIVLTLLFCAYFYFVVGSVFNIIARKDADARSGKLQETIGGLESEYFALSQSLTPATAAHLGLAPVAETQYVYRPGNAASAAEPVHAI